jgi:hypothetical protein
MTENNSKKEERKEIRRQSRKLKRNTSEDSLSMATEVKLGKKEDGRKVASGTTPRLPQKTSWKVPRRLFSC